MTLVVNKESRLPGDGYFMDLGYRKITEETKRDVLRRELARCRGWSWTDATPPVTSTAASSSTPTAT